MANVNVTSDAWTQISITSGTVQNISATADIELSAEQTDNSGVVLKPSELYQWDNETIYARAVTENTGALRVVNFKKAAGGGGGYVLPVASSSTLGGVKIGSNLTIDESGVLSGTAVSGGQNYSTTEQQIGTWIDGEPLYQITIVDTMPTVVTDGVFVDKTINISNLRINLMTDIKGVVAIASGGKGTISIPSTNLIANNYFRVIMCSRTDTTHDYLENLIIRESQLVYSNAPCYITLQYTKTTD